MHVVNRLPRRATAVEDKPVAGFADAFLLRDCIRCKEHFAKEFCVTFIELGDRFNVLARHDKHVRGRLGSNVAKRHDQVAFVNELCRQAPIDNAAKKCTPSVTSLLCDGHSYPPATAPPSAGQGTPNRICKRIARIVLIPTCISRQEASSKAVRQTIGPRGASSAIMAKTPSLYGSTSRTARSMPAIIVSLLT